MKIFIEKKNKNLSIKFNGSGFQLLKKLKINPEEVIIVKNDTLITLGDKLADRDAVKILSVVSGG